MQSLHDLRYLEILSKYTNGYEVFKSPKVNLLSIS